MPTGEVYDAPTLTILGSVGGLTAGQTGGVTDKSGSLPLTDSTG